MKVIHTKSFEETQSIGQNFAGEILASNPQKSLPADEAGAVVLALQGDLGAGKTTFLQGFAKGLGINEVVNSPTFIVMKKFQIPNYKSQINSKFKTFYHFDLYRLENEKDLEFLHLQEVISDPKNIIAIEWPEKLGNVLPKDAVKITFEHLSENERELTILN